MFSLTTLRLLATWGDPQATRVLRLGYVSAHATPTGVLYPTNSYRPRAAREALHDALRDVSVPFCRKPL